VGQSAEVGALEQHAPTATPLQLCVGPLPSYVPPVDAQPLPTVYFHDGTVQLGAGSLGSSSGGHVGGVGGVLWEINGDRRGQ
jgi:hypothetical protein